MSLARAILATCAAFSLQGCVLAAAAIPLAAGGAMIGANIGGERTRQAIAEGNALDPEAVEIAAQSGYTLVDRTTLPEPVAAPTGSGAYADWSRFSRRSLDQAQPAYSALLLEPGNLQPTRAPCEADLPAVLIDLDPAGELMPLAEAGAPQPAFIRTIDAMRGAGIAIAWITDREPTDAGAIRRVLRESGLDPIGRDPLFVQRFPGETKQERRQALLETHCLLAIAGDERADFDDLYTYILDPTLADGLEPMIGEGWFLIPTPFD